MSLSIVNERESVILGKKKAAIFAAWLKGDALDVSI